MEQKIKDKAKELVDKWDSLLSNFKSTLYSYRIDFAKKYAQDECDIRLEQIGLFPINNFSKFQHEEITEQRNFWQYVKEEITKL